MDLQIYRKTSVLHLTAPSDPSSPPSRNSIWSIASVLHPTAPSDPSSLQLHLIYHFITPSSGSSQSILSVLHLTDLSIHLVLSSIWSITSTRPHKTIGRWMWNMHEVIQSICSLTSPDSLAQEASLLNCQYKTCSHTHPDWGCARLSPVRKSGYVRLVKITVLFVKWYQFHLASDEWVQACQHNKHSWYKHTHVHIAYSSYITMLHACGESLTPWDWISSQSSFSWYCNYRWM